MTEVTHAMRSRARRLVLQALYQWQISATDVAEIKVQFANFNDMRKVDEHFFNELLSRITQQSDEIDNYFIPYLDRKITELNPIELAVLRIGSYELVKRPDVPYKVVIDEGLRLTKSFGSAEGHKYVNAILDKVAQHYRRDEIRAG